MPFAWNILLISKIEMISTRHVAGRASWWVVSRTLEPTSGTILGLNAAVSASVSRYVYNRRYLTILTTDVVV